MSKLRQKVDKAMRFSDVVYKVLTEDEMLLRKQKTQEFQQEYRSHLMTLRRMYMNLANDITRELEKR